MLRIDKNKKMKCPHCFTVMDDRPELLYVYYDFNDCDEEDFVKLEEK